MKEPKNSVVSVRINERQKEFLEKLVQEGKAKTVASALQYLINKEQTLN